MTKTYEPDGDGTKRCQCVRDHITFIDKTWPQCGTTPTASGHPLINGLCRQCFDTHGEMLASKTVTSNA